MGKAMKNSSCGSNVVVKAALPPALHSIIVSDVAIRVKTAEPIEFVDLTDHINDHLRSSGIENGAVTVFSMHTTAAIKINEAEELLIEDFKHFLSRLCPTDHGYNHNDMSRRKPPIAPNERPNGHSHCMHLLLSTSETIPVADSRLALGTWQRVFMIELDGPRERDVIVRCHSYVPQVLPLRVGRNGRAHVAIAPEVQFGNAK